MNEWLYHCFWKSRIVCQSHCDFHLSRQTRNQPLNHLTCLPSSFFLPPLNFDFSWKSCCLFLTRMSWLIKWLTNLSSLWLLKKCVTFSLVSSYFCRLAIVVNSTASWSESHDHFAWTVLTRFLFLSVSFPSYDYTTFVREVFLKCSCVFWVNICKLRPLVTKVP